MPTPTFDAPQSPIEAILQNMLGANNTLRQPQSRNEALLLQILDAMQHGGGDVTAEAVLAALEDMTDEEAAAALAAIDGEPEKLAVSITKTGNQYSADKTYAEITAAVAAGQIVSASYAGTEVYLASAKSGTDIQFFSLVPKSGLNLAEGFTLTLYALASNEAMTVATIDYPPSAVDAASVAAAISSFSAAQASAALSALGGEAAPTIVNVSGQTPSITAQDNTIYQCGNISALTLSSFPAQGRFSVAFTAYPGSVTTSFPSSLVGLENFTADADYTYEINVWDGRAVAGAFPYTPPAE